MTQRRPFALTAYLGFVRKARNGHSHPETPRPDGTLIWLHANSVERAAALSAVGRRLVQSRQNAFLLLTGPFDPSGDDDITVTLPNDNTGDVHAFLSHWRPDLIIWQGNGLRPALHVATREAGIPSVLVDFSDSPTQTPAPRWLPDVSGIALQSFDRLFAQTRTGARNLTRLGVDETSVMVFGGLTETGVALPCNIDEQEEMAEFLAGRPVWLAALPTADELDRILRSHRRAGRFAQRLLLVIVPRNPEDWSRFERAVIEADLRLCNWAAGEMPDDNTQVLLADDPSALGLWLRLSPVSFLGGSLDQDDTHPMSPYDAAALGSAILHGPHTGQQAEAFAQLAAAHAVRVVRDTDDLAQAVVELTAPHKAALMAQAGWEAVTEGAALADAVFEWCMDALDRREAG